MKGTADLPYHGAMGGVPSRIYGRRSSLMICLIAYLAAAVVAQVAAFAAAKLHPVLAAALADVAATIVIFLFSLGFDNSSLYDPYWSVIPPFIGLFWLLRSGVHGVRSRQILVLALVLLWAVRLTWNWLRHWRGLAYEDWRYAGYRCLGAVYWPLSFAGFHLMPTVLVFLGCLSLYPAFSATRPFNALDVLAAAVSLGAITVETLADLQLARFLRDSVPGEVMDRGLWALSRHPNYFGEVLFWWGLYLFALAASPAWWWMVAGPLAITGLFLGVSIPMMDRHLLATRPGYREQLRRRPAFLPGFPRLRRRT